MSYITYMITLTYEMLLAALVVIVYWVLMIRYFKKW